jgi:hypothetical protein
MDEDLEYFLSKWGQPTERVPATEADLARLAQHVPPILIEYWREIGFSVFKEGLMTVTNPLEWMDVTNEWVAGTELAELDTFIPIMRGAFGRFRLLGLKHGYKASLEVTMAAYFGDREKPRYDLNISIKGGFSGSNPDDYDTGDKTLDFAKALKKLGPLKPNEMYGFVPVLPMGGTRDLKHLQKLDAFAHLSILRQATGKLRGIMEYADIYRQ